MSEKFNKFISQLKETNFSLEDYVDFSKVAANVDAIAIKLNQLNYLIGQENMRAAVYNLWNENPKVFSVLDVLIAVRAKDKKKVIDTYGNVRLLNDFFKSPEDVMTFMDSTGLTTLMCSGQIKNLVDYVFGVEVGLDSNARKNRGGDKMERIINDAFIKYGLLFDREVYDKQFHEIVDALGIDNKRFDFVVYSKDKTYLIETNFYSSGGSKLNEVARAYSELVPKINAVPGFEFVWITDGIGWKSARNKLEEAFAHIPNIYNLSTLHEFISKVQE